MKVFAVLVALICATQAAHSADVPAERKFLRDGASAGNTTDSSAATSGTSKTYTAYTCSTTRGAVPDNGFLFSVPDLDLDATYDDMVTIGKYYCSATTDCDSFVVRVTNTKEKKQIRLYDRTMPMVIKNCDWDTYAGNQDADDDA